MPNRECPDSWIPPLRALRDGRWAKKSDHFTYATHHELAQSGLFEIRWVRGAWKIRISDHGRAALARLEKDAAKKKEWLSSLPTSATLPESNLDWTKKEENKK